MHQVKLCQINEEPVGVKLLRDYLIHAHTSNFRYTDLLNNDQNVRDLLTGYIVGVKKINRAPITSEARVLWLVNTIK